MIFNKYLGIKGLNANFSKSFEKYSDSFSFRI
jgi:hypothetical protein